MGKFLVVDSKAIHSQLSSPPKRARGRRCLGLQEATSWQELSVETDYPPMGVIREGAQEEIP